MNLNQINSRKKDNDYNYYKYEDDSFYDDYGTMIMGFFYNNKNIFYLSGISYSSRDPYEPCEYDDYNLSIYEDNNFNEIFNSSFYNANLEKLTEKCNGNLMFHFDFDKKID